ncbi:MAG: class I SAM-dependent methyltransferase [Lachnospiraceae bacterium]|nr:class I SAM-dependent methyltransferase [Lachnospiraceae bacterium]
MKKYRGGVFLDSFESVYLNEYGYYELRKKNTQEERKQNFEIYFQNYSGATYMKEYPEDELSFMMNKIAERAYVIEENLSLLGNLKGGRYSLLEVGCGEGFLMQYFYDKGVQVKGMDIGSYALEHFHPDMMPFYEQGDIETLLPKMIENKEKYDVISLDRVMDMMLDVPNCLRLVKELMTDKSVFVVKVANNYSRLQQMLLKSGEVQKDYWLDDPDHTGYFNREGLINLLEGHGYTCLDFYADTFVDFHLLNPLTNYYEKPEVGKTCHNATVRLENLLHDVSIERTIDIYRMLGDMGFGREIIGVFKKAD